MNGGILMKLVTINR